MSKRHHSLIDRWMPLYAKDYLLDTAHLTTEEHGAYLLLLMRAWLNDGVLPSDETILRRLVYMDEKRWKATRKTILAFFVSAADGWHSPRLDLELNIAKGIIAKRSEAGRASGEARREKQKAPNPANDEQANDEHMFPVCSDFVEQNTPKMRTHVEQTANHTYEQTANPLPIQDIHTTGANPILVESADFAQPTGRAEIEKIPSRFDEFWSVYPKKVGRKDAARIWASKKLDRMADLIIADVTKRASTHRPWRDGFVLNPSTYLRGERWTDAMESGAVGLSPHNDFEKRDYTVGINPDGSF